MESTNLLSRLGIPLPGEDGLPTIPEILPSPNYREGETIMNRYLVKELFHGSMGDVYHCRDTRRDTDVALKTIIGAGKLDHSRMISFSREIDLLLNLPVHPNVITLQRVELIDGYAFLVTEWVSGNDGSTLSDWQKSKAFTCADIVSFMQQIACGLDHCQKHLSVPGRAYLFGDIKPDNIYVTWNGVFKLGDFSGGHTEGWCAPELVDGLPGDVRSDVYGLGLVANKMLSGVSDFGSDLSDSLDEIFLRCTAIDPNDRYESIAALQEELKALCIRFGLKQYDETKFYGRPFKDEYNRRMSALNLGFVSKDYNPGKDYDLLVHGWHGGAFESIHDFIESTNPAEKTLFTAKTNYVAGKLDDALAVLSKPLFSPELLHLKASVLYGKGNLEDCIHCLLSAILIDDHLPSYDLIATIFLDYPAFAARYQHEIAAIQSRLQKIKVERLTGYLPYQVLAKFYMIQKDYKMASSSFRKSLQFLNPEADWQTLYYYGSCEALSGHTDKADIIYSRVVELICSDPNYLMSSYKCCILFYSLVALGCTEKAEELAALLKSKYNLDFSSQIAALKQRDAQYKSVR